MAESSESDCESYCICGERAHGEMIACEGRRCVSGRWFHLSCVGLNRLPRGEWLCPSCSDKAKRRAARAREEVVPAKRRKVRNVEEYIPEEDPRSSPLKVKSAERQSRTTLDEMLASARPAIFRRSGAVDTRACPEIAGLAVIDLDAETFAALTSLHDVIVRRLRRDRRLTAWAGVAEGDGRQRGYAFLPRSFGTFGKARLAEAGVAFHAAAKTGRDAAEDEAANWRSCVRLKEAEVQDHHRAALTRVAAALKKLLPPKYKKLATTADLEALQPNLHNGLDHLPPHLDHPLNDGFGVIILTLCVKGTGNILVVPEEKDAAHKSNRPYFFEAKPGQAYVLAGPARNACDHGVVCPLPSTRSKAASTNLATDSRHRESLNLRFGIHSNRPGRPFYALDEMPILKTLDF